MFKQSKLALFASLQIIAIKSVAIALITRNSIANLLTTAHHTLLFFGIAAITMLALMFFKPDFASKIQEEFNVITQLGANDSTLEQVVTATEPTDAMDMPTQPFQQAAQAADSGMSSFSQQARPNSSQKAGVSMQQQQQQQQWVTAWLSKRYRVANDAAHLLVSTSYITAEDIRLDPLLILAVMAIESGLNPIAESPMGAQGLMQVMSKMHHQRFQKLGGIKEALNPVANIKVGSSILKEYVTRGGSVEAGLKSYVGAAAFETDSGYGSRVMAEYRRLKIVAAGQSVPIFTRRSGSPMPVKVSVKMPITATVEEEKSESQDNMPTDKPEQIQEQVSVQESVQASPMPIKTGQVAEL
jgi:hypothetical protein